MFPSTSPFAIDFGNASGAPYNCSFGCATPPCFKPMVKKMVVKDTPFDSLDTDARNIVDMKAFVLLKKDSAYTTAGTPDDSLFIAYRDSLENTNIGKIYRFSEKLELGDTLGAYSEIISIIPECIPENNHKIVNEIYWRTWVKNIFEFSPADSLALYLVAEQRPHQGGTAVYDARVMLGLDFFDFEDDQQKMLSNSTGDQPSNVNNHDNRISFYPNPSSSIVNYEIELSQSENAMLVFIDMMGREVLSIALNSENLIGSIDSSSLSGGMYNYEMRPDSGQTIKGKIVINK